MMDFIHPLIEEKDKILFIRGAKDGKYPYSHSLLIGDYLIDTGISPRLLRKVIKLHEINHVILSHWHEDHISGNFMLKKARFSCHHEDKTPIENVREMIPYYYLSGTSIEDDFRNLIKYMGMQNVRIDKTINDNDIIIINDNLRLKVIHTPGHTAGHCSFYLEDYKIGFLADIDLSNFPFYGTIDASIEQFEKSIKKLINIDFELVISSHKGLIEGKNKIKEELKNYGKIIQKREEHILQQFNENKPLKIESLKGKNLIYKKYKYMEYELIAELVMIKKHVKKLTSMGFLEQANGGYILK